MGSPSQVRLHVTENPQLVNRAVHPIHNNIKLLFFFYFTEKSTLLFVCHAASKKLTTSLQMLLISQINLLVLESVGNSTLNFIASSKSGFPNDIYRVHEHKNVFHLLVR